MTSAPLPKKRPCRQANFSCARTFLYCFFQPGTEGIARRARFSLHGWGYLSWQRCQQSRTSDAQREQGSTKSLKFP